MRWELRDLAANVIDCAKQSLKLVGQLPLDDPRMEPMKQVMACLVDAAAIMDKAKEEGDCGQRL